MKIPRITQCCCCGLKTGNIFWCWIEFFTSLCGLMICTYVFFINGLYGTPVVITIDTYFHSYKYCEHLVNSESFDDSGWFCITLLDFLNSTWMFFWILLNLYGFYLTFIDLPRLICYPNWNFLTRYDFYVLFLLFVRLHVCFVISLDFCYSLWLL